MRWDNYIKQSPTQQQEGINFDAKAWMNLKSIILAEKSQTQQAYILLQFL
jgi:hypothetical protein